MKQFPAPLAGSFTETNFRDDENTLVVGYGLAATAGEEAVKFVLNMDYFTEKPYQIGGNPAVTDMLRYFSDGMTSFFHWAVQDSYKKALKPQPRREERK